MAKMLQVLYASSIFLENILFSGVEIIALEVGELLVCFSSFIHMDLICLIYESLSSFWWGSRKLLHQFKYVCLTGFSVKLSDYVTFPHALLVETVFNSSNGSL